MEYFTKIGHMSLRQYTYLPTNDAEKSEKGGECNDRQRAHGSFDD